MVPCFRKEGPGHGGEHDGDGFRGGRTSSKATSTRVSLYRGAVITRPRSFSGTWRNPSIYLTLLVLSTRRNEAPGVPEASQSPPLIHLSGTRRAHGIERHRASDFLAGALR